MRREWLRLRIGIAGLVALGVGVTINVFGIVFPALVPRVDIVVADVLPTVYIVGYVAIPIGIFVPLLFLKERDLKRAKAWVVANWRTIQSRLGRRRLAAERVVVAVLPLAILGVVVADAVWRNPTEAAALGTVSAIGYVAYQSWHTRRAADAAVRGLTTAEHALRVSQAMAAEAEKRRLDLRAPTVRVSIGDPNWPPIQPRLLANPSQTDSSPYIPETRLEAGYVYRLPKNRDDLIGLWVEGQVSNEGSTTVEVKLRGLRLYDAPVVPAGRDVDPDDIVLTNPGTFRRPLPPGKTLCFRLQGESPVSAWITNYRARHSGAQGTWDDPASPLAAVVQGVVVIDDGDDNGVLDSWSVTLTGCPLEPVPEEAESWQIPRMEHGRVPIDARVGLRRRTYWRSKERGLQLPTPEV